MSAARPTTGEMAPATGNVASKKRSRTTPVASGTSDNDVGSAAGGGAVGLTPSG